MWQQNSELHPHQMDSQSEGQDLPDDQWWAGTQDGVSCAPLEINVVSSLQTHRPRDWPSHSHRSHFITVPGAASEVFTSGDETDKREA